MLDTQANSQIMTTRLNSILTHIDTTHQYEEFRYVISQLAYISAQSEAELPLNVRSDACISFIFHYNRLESALQDMILGISSQPGDSEL